MGQIPRSTERISSSLMRLPTGCGLIDWLIGNHFTIKKWKNKYLIVICVGIVRVARRAIVGVLRNVAVVDPQTMRSHHHPIVAFARRPPKLVYRDALDASTVTALRVGREDGEVDNVAHFLRQVAAVVFLEDFLSRFTCIISCLFMIAAYRILITDLCCFTAA